MKKLLVKIPGESTAQAITFLQRPGAAVKEKDITSARKKKALVSPTFLFGKWKNIDLDAKELRKKAWNRGYPW